MANRSLKASVSGQSLARQSMQRKGWTQDYLAAQAGLSTRNSVWKFLTGRAIERHIFLEICFQLGLDWEEIVDLAEDSVSFNEPESLSELEPITTDELVNLTRSQLKPSIESQWSTLRSYYDLTQSLRLQDVYTPLNLLTHLTHQQWLDVSDLQKDVSETERFRLQNLTQNTIPALDAIQSQAKLVILGKPGSGKTTLLQYLALQCIEGTVLGDRVPVLIPLRSYASFSRDHQDWSIFNYLRYLWENQGISQKTIENLIQHGKVLFLLDGLDEINQADSENILQPIQQFADTYYQNYFVLTCRISSQFYYFNGFTYLEVADFDQQQIERFSQQWFMTVAQAFSPNQITLVNRFLEQINRSENQPIRDLASTPLLLNLVCSVFRERGNFPSNRVKLYQEGLEILLNRWDQSRGIKRDQVYRNLSLADKIKLLSTIAAQTFEQGQYFFEKTDLLRQISAYLTSLPDSTTDPESLLLDSEAILNAIVSQHGLLIERSKGIYSFSHLTFQEYLTARKIVSSPTSEILQKSLDQLVENSLNPRWREVILLTTSMLPQPQSFLQKILERINRLAQNEVTLKDFFKDLTQKVNSVQSPYSIAAIRAFYFSLVYNWDFNLGISLEPKLAGKLEGELAIDMALIRAFSISSELVNNPNIVKIFNLFFALDLDHRFPIKTEALSAFQSLKKKLPNPEQGEENLLKWWKENGKRWQDSFREFLVKYRCLGKNWYFSPHQRHLLQEYYGANQFFVTLLHSTSQLTSPQRKGIEVFLLNPS
ncbi:MAG: NACHT domain-containing NTPase [Snowella sp.]|nr:NACHT domain-containing NTPase [Snowella sp.]